MGYSTPQSNKFLMFSRMEISQPLWSPVPILSLFHTKYWLGLLALHVFCKDIIDLLFIYILTLPDGVQSAFLLWQLLTWAPQLKHLRLPLIPAQGRSNRHSWQPAQEHCPTEALGRDLWYHSSCCRWCWCTLKSPCSQLGKSQYLAPKTVAFKSWRKVDSFSLTLSISTGLFDLFSLNKLHT